MNERLDLLYGEDSFSYLSSKTVLVVGLGGVGGYAVEALVRCGISKLILVDYDCVTESNLNRQLIALSDTLGKAKTTCFKTRIQLINPNCCVDEKKIKVGLENVLELFDQEISFVLDACDDKEAKLALSKICQEKNIPYIMALGAGKRRNLKEVQITTLDKTKEDPLARKMRHLYRKQNLSLNIPVVCSKEVPQKSLEPSPVASSIFVPATCGLLAAQYIIEYFLSQKEKDVL